MKHTKLILFVLLLLGISCSKDFLDTKPSGATTKNDAFASRNDFATALNGCYSGLQDAGYYGCNFPIIGEVLADNVKPAKDNLARFTDIYNFSQTPSDQYLKSFWKAGYAVIHRCNTLLKATEQDSTILTASERDSYRGQALGLRALAHFDLYNVFSPRYDAANKDMPAIPLVLDSTFDKGYVSVGRTAVDKLFATLITDVTESRLLLDKESLTPYYFSKYAATALLARMSLSIGDYRSAFVHSMNLIQSNHFSLLSNGDYLKSWHEKSTSESIFSISFDQNDFSGTESFGYLYSEKGYGDFIPTSDISRLFSVNDVRKNLIQNGFCVKFQNNEKIIGLANFPVFRLSEIYLILAESGMRLKLYSNLNLNDEDLAQQLDLIRMRADISATKTKSQGEYLLEDIMTERRKELCFEGQRFFDLKRLKKSITRNDCNSQNCTMDYGASHQLYTMPIPISEFNANQNITQNEGY